MNRVRRKREAIRADAELECGHMSAIESVPGTGGTELIRVNGLRLSARSRPLGFRRTLARAMTRHPVRLQELAGTARASDFRLTAINCGHAVARKLEADRHAVPLTGVATIRSSAGAVLQFVL
jgi:hypothetical protein